MYVAGIIVEYNPLHAGHIHLIREIRQILGEETAIVCAMSGYFVQRGDFALVNRRARARAAVESGIDLVLELPLPWAVSSAEAFADGGVQTLMATGILTHLAFGSECGNVDQLQQLAESQLTPDFDRILRQKLLSGISFAAARQKTAEELLQPETAELLSQPNNVLGVEYCKALLRRKSAIQPLSILRKGAGHDEPAVPGENPSASVIRKLLTIGEREQALALMAPAMEQIYREEEIAGRAPVLASCCERAVLARLRTMSEQEFADLDQGREGLCHRLYAASREATSVEAILEAAKTKRYAYARLRRMILWAFLGLNPAEFPEYISCLRPLAANAVGRKLLAKMRKTASVPVLTKTADVRKLSVAAQQQLKLEARAADLYTLAYPNLTAAAGGSVWKEGPLIL